ncbi:MAG: phosphatidylglycerophosphatase A [Gammaproteobacteria bacterium]|nr:phosphatidylglycerophosphatase A [Gammaproteobacteria bacterium]
MRHRPRAARVPARLLLDPGHWLALGAGSGLSPWAPGTCGSAAALLLYWPLANSGPLPILGMACALFALGVPLCGRTARVLGEHDHGAIVLDEVVGMLLTVSFCSSGVVGVVVGFCAFRFFDIVKPWPVRWADGRVQGGLGIMLDDLLAGLYGLIVVEIFEYISFGYKLFE